MYVGKVCAHCAATMRATGGAEYLTRSSVGASPYDDNDESRPVVKRGYEITITRTETRYMLAEYETDVWERYGYDRGTRVTIEPCTHPDTYGDSRPLVTGGLVSLRRDVCEECGETLPAVVSFDTYYRIPYGPRWSKDPNAKDDYYLDACDQWADESRLAHI